MRTPLAQSDGSAMAMRSGSTLDVRKAAQVAAFFARAEGGRINVLKLSKLIYLADREFADRFDEPMLHDQLVSMDHGPVNSATLNYVNGLFGADRDWDEFIAPRIGYDIPLARPVQDDDLDHLSSTDHDVLAHTWSRFGGMSQYEIRDYTHNHCPEWENPRGSSNPISYERLFKFLHKAGAEELAEAVEDTQELNRAFAKSERGGRDAI